MAGTTARSAGHAEEGAGFLKVANEGRICLKKKRGNCVGIWMNQQPLIKTNIVLSFVPSRGPQLATRNWQLACLAVCFIDHYQVLNPTAQI